MRGARPPTVMAPKLPRAPSVTPRGSVPPGAPWAAPSCSSPPQQQNPQADTGPESTLEISASTFPSRPHCLCHPYEGRLASQRLLSLKCRMTHRMEHWREESHTKGLISPLLLGLSSRAPQGKPRGAHSNAGVFAQLKRISSLTDGNCGDTHRLPTRQVRGAGAHEMPPSLEMPRETGPGPRIPTNS